MKIDLINFHKCQCTGLMYIDTSDKKYSFDNAVININNETIPIYEYFKVKNIYTLSTETLYNKCNISGLYSINSNNYYGAEKSILLTRINEDESEIISNIDSDSNYIIDNNCKLYKAGRYNNIDIYYCYDCGKFNWK